MSVEDAASEMKLRVVIVHVGTGRGKNVFLPKAEKFIIVIYDSGN